MTDEIELGFETIGNATLIAYDRGPRLVTDPWLFGHPYFGSWSLLHEIPERQLAAIRSCDAVWISHGHPDHLHAPSLELLRGKRLLVPDHVGGRVAGALRDGGHRVEVLPDRRWTTITPRLRVCCVADYNQDAVLLVDLDGVLVADLNDASDHGWRGFVRREVARARLAFHLHIAPWGEADMTNLFDETGARIPRFPHPRPVGRTVAEEAEALGTRFVVPFSSMHRYQRRDSAWANEHTVGLADWADGFESERVELLPAYVQYDVLRDRATAIDPSPTPEVLREPAEFGDDWDETLEADEAGEIERYLRRFSHPDAHFDFVSFLVGGTEHRIGLGGGSTAPALTFEVPRASLLAAVRNEVFDDLLIGNFMRTHLHRTADPEALYPHFTPYVGKFGDNGRAHSEAELRAYFAAYRRRAPVDHLRHRLESRAEAAARSLLPPGSRARDGLRRLRHRLLSRAPSRRRGGPASRSRRGGARGAAGRGTDR